MWVPTNQNIVTRAHYLDSKGSNTQFLLAHASSNMFNHLEDIDSTLTDG